MPAQGPLTKAETEILAGGKKKSRVPKQALTIRDNGIQMDREIQNPVYECKTTAHPLNPFAT